MSAVIEKSLSDKELCDITVDRRKEFFWAEKLEKDLRAKAYFCLPHHPLENISNENTNGLLRNFSQKGESIDKISKAEVQKRFNALNSRPRKRLNWNYPAEARAFPWMFHYTQSCLFKREPKIFIPPRD